MDHSPYPVRAEMSPQSHIRDVSEQNRSTAPTTHDSCDLNHEWCTPVAIALRTAAPKSHTHVQQVAACIHVDTRRPVMDLDRGILARIDRKLLAGLDDAEAFQMVRVPVPPAKWSTWRRYCDMVGISMGRAIVTLIDNELRGVFGESTVDEVPIFAARAEERLTTREAQVDACESAVKRAEEHLRTRTERLRHCEAQLEARELLADLASNLAPRPKANAKVGRDDPCPCGSGSKYKRCHGR